MTPHHQYPPIPTNNERHSPTSPYLTASQYHILPLFLVALLPEAEFLVTPVCFPSLYVL